MPLLATRGGGSVQGFGRHSATGPATYIENVMSTYLYTGNGSTQTITNGFPLAGLASNTNYTATNGISFSVDSNGLWQYVRNGSAPMEIYKQNTFYTQITLPTNTQYGWGGSCTDSSGNNYYGFSYAHSSQRYLHVLKLNPAGDTVLWDRQIYVSGADNFGYAVATDGTNVYFVGQTGDPEFKGVLFSLSCSTGTINWHRALSVAFGVYLYSVALDSSGNVYVGGYSGGSDGSGHGYIAKFNSSGTLQTQSTFRNSDASVKSIAIDTDGDIYIAGTNSAQKYYIRKLNSSFTEQWVRTFSTSANQATWIDIGVGTNTCTIVFTDATLNITYVAVFSKSGTFYNCSSAPGHLSLGGSAGQNRTPTYKNGKLYLLLNKIYEISEADLVFGTNVLSGSGIPVSDTSISWTAGTNPTNTSWSYTTTVLNLSASKSNFNPASSTVPGVKGEGGLVWIKSRSSATDHQLFDTARGASKELISNSNAAEATDADTLTAFNSDGFSLGADSNTNTNAATYVSWTFRKQAKFFDVVTYTGDGVNGRTVAHNLGSAPGCVIVKRTDLSSNWIFCHRSANFNMWLNSTSGEGAGEAQLDGFVQKSSLSSTTFTLFSGGNGITAVNQNGATYVAYLFAHDAGGFGASGSDNVISCGSSTGSAVDLGWEPQWLLYRSSNFTDDWHIIDNMRGAAVGSPTYNTWSNLNANAAAAETSVTGSAGNPNIKFTATGFVLGAIAGTAIYIAIRRGPMKTPTTGTSVYGAYAKPLSETINSINPGFTSDLMIAKNRSGGTASGAYWFDRLRGMANPSPYIISSNTGAEGTQAGKQYGQSAASNNAVSVGPGANTNLEYDDPSNESVFWFLRRAPGFFDVVVANNNGSTGVFTSNHNLGTTPTLCIARPRTAAQNWVVAVDTGGGYRLLNLNQNYSDQGAATFTANATSFTWSSYAMGFGNDSSVAYLFATCPGVSKIGSYTGNGSSQTINCGFTGGARFVLIKRTDSTGDWYVWDTARGIIAANDPHLSLNSTVAEVTGNDSIDPDNSGFIVNQNATTNINVTSATYIYLAIA